MCPKTEFNPQSTPISPPPFTSRHRKVTKNYTLKAFFVIFIVVYSPILAYILIQVAYGVHAHAQFKMIGKQSYKNDCSS